MRHRVDHRLAYRGRRKVPALAAAHGADLRSVQQVLLHEADRLLDRPYREGADLRAVHNIALVGALEPSDLDPGVRKMSIAVLTKEQHPAHGRHFAALMG